MNDISVNLLDVARDYVSKGLSVISTNKNKRPVFSHGWDGKWKRYQEQLPDDEDLMKMFHFHPPCIAVICGKISGNLEIIDFDLQNDTTGELWEKFSNFIEEVASGLFKKLIVQRTQSGGRHIIYRCSEVEGSQKLAMNEDKPPKVMIETKGEAGYFLCAPSTGYVFTQKNFSDIPTLTTEERESILTCARTFDRKEKTLFTPRKTKKPKANINSQPVNWESTEGNTPLNDYDKKINPIDLLADQGWDVVAHHAGTTYFRRPGKTKGLSASFNPPSAYGHQDRFYFYTTSCQFPHERLLKPSSVYAYIHHGGDFSAAASALYHSGYGERHAPGYSATPPTESEGGEAPVRRKKLTSEEILDFMDGGEFGDAALFTAIAREKCVFDHTEGIWYKFKTHWERDNTKKIIDYAQKNMVKKYMDVSCEFDKKFALEQQKYVMYVEPTKNNPVDTNQKRMQHYADCRDALRKRCHALKNLRRIDSVLKIAMTGRFLGIAGTEWDKDYSVLGTKNGVVDLKTGEFRKQKPTDYIKKYAPTEWLGLSALRLKWEKFILELADGDMELYLFLQRLLGQALLGDAIEHVFPIIYGAQGRNGKETQFEVLRSVLGELAKPINKDVIISSKRPTLGAPQPELYDLWGVRLAWLSETAKEERLNVSRVKHLSGGGTIKCRPLHGNMVEFEPSHTLFLFTNHKPYAPPEDAALWDRVFLINYRRKYVDNPDPNNPNEYKKNLHLKRELQEEKPGILAWLVEGCLMWQKEGLNVPQSIINDTAEYRIEVDYINNFFNEIFDFNVPEDENSLPLNDIFLIYKNWAKENNLSRPIGKHSLAKKLEVKMRRIDDRRLGRVYFEGVPLRDEFAELLKKLKRAETN